MIRERLLNRGDDIREGGHVKDPVDAHKPRRDAPDIRDVRLVDGERRVAAHVREVRQPARAEIVDNDHLVAVRQQPLDEMAADKAGAAGYQSEARTRTHGDLSEDPGADADP